MKGGRQIKEYKTIPGSLLMAIFLLICVLLTAQTMSKYANGAAGGGQARVASFQVKADRLETFEQEFTATLQPGDQETYTFSIENQSETAVQVKAKLFTEGNLPLQIFYGLGENPAVWTELTENLQEKWEDLSWTHDLEPNAGKQDYTIKVTWPERQNSYQYNQGVLALKLRVDVQQAD